MLSTTEMTTNQILHLPEGSLLWRKTLKEMEPQYGQVVEESDGAHIIIAWEQESHPLYGEIDDARSMPRWSREAVPVDISWWRHWKRVA